MFTHLGLQDVLTIVDYYPAHTPAGHQKSAEKSKENDMQRPIYAFQLPPLSALSGLSVIARDRGS